MNKRERMDSLNTLLKGGECPDWFAYPKEFEDTVSHGIIDLEPWIILTGVRLRDMHSWINKLYPNKSIVPFALKRDTEDLACWIRGGGGDVIVIRDYPTKIWNELHYTCFWDWLRVAVEDFIEHNL